MSLAVLYSHAFNGIDPPEVLVEVHLANGLPYLQLLAYMKLK